MKPHIGNLPKTLTEPELRTLIVAFAEPSSLEIARDRGSESKGYGFAEFANDDLARAVITGLAGREISGQKLTVAEARPRKSDTRGQTPSVPRV